MNKTEQVIKAKNLLQQALLLTGNNESQQATEAKSHIRQAMVKLEQITRKAIGKNQPNNKQFSDWWSNVVSGTANASQAQHSQQSQQKSLSELNDMISQEQKRLNELEKQSQEANPAPNELISD